MYHMGQWKEKTDHFEVVRALCFIKTFCLLFFPSQDSKLNPHPHPQKKPAQNELKRSMHILNHHHHPQLHTQRHTYTHTHRCTHTHTQRHTHRGTHTAYLFNTGRTPPVPFGHVR